MTIQFYAPTPILRMFDIAATRAFYLDYLGFELKWEHRFADVVPLYMEIARGGCAIHLSEHHGDCTPVSALRIPVSDALALHAELAARDYPFQKPGYDPAEKEICLTDPSGNRLILFEASPQA
jgi:catechol 2,3-dioxygenase-like lactoylglutathione lyase family enzyme